MKRHTFFTVLVAVVVLTAASDIPVMARTDEEPVAQFSGTVDVNVVDLFVSAVDAEGRPVTDLDAEDFSVFEDGQPRPISNFSTWREGRVAEVEPAGGTGPAASDVAQEPLSLAFLFDVSSLSPHEQRQVEHALDHLLASERNAEVLVAAATPDLEVVQPFTTDLEAARAALGKISHVRVAGAATRQSRRLLVSDIRQAPITEPEARRLELRLESYRSQEQARIDGALGSLERLTQAISGRPGRKVVVWIGEDLAMQPALDVYRQFASAFAMLQGELRLDPPEMWARQADLSRRFEAAVGSAQAAGVTVFALDASNRDAEQLDAYTGVGDVSTRTGSVAGGVAVGANQLMNALDAVNGAAYMAHATGGDVYANTRDFDAVFTKLASQLDAVYFIGYTRPEAPDGTLHSIDVRVDRPGVVVRYHEKVLDRTDEQRLVDLLTSRLVINAGTNELGIELQAGKKAQAADGQLSLPLQVAVPASALSFVPDQQKPPTVELTMATRAETSSGQLLEPALRRVKLTLPSSVPDAGLRAGTTLTVEVPPDTSALAVAIRDELSGVVSTARLTL